ncbi:hypothetical protein PVAP13_6KG019333, partial [Panicum virgatum]
MPTVHIKAPRRGNFTCIHGKEVPPIADTEGMNHRAMVEPLLKHYVEAARRLPLAEMPYLLESRGLKQEMTRLPYSCVRDNGICVGLLDPTSNIIVNAINLFCHRCRLRESEGVLAKRMRMTYAATYDPSNEDTYVLVSYGSHDGLFAFMHSYFRYLSTKQAQRYLYLARYDFVITVLLVEHERQVKHPASPRPGCARTRAALMFPDEQLLSRLMELRTGRSLNVNDVEYMANLLDQHLLHHLVAKINFMCRPNGSICLLGNFVGKNKMYFIVDHLEDNLCVAGTVMEKGNAANNKLSPIHLHRAQDEEDMLKTLRKAASNSQPRHDLRNLADTECQYITSLEMYLVDIVHAFYIKALAQLPADALRNRHLRGILAGGHCYGPLDPVSNIILNSRWYEFTFPRSPFSAGLFNVAAADILSTGPLLRMVLNSIDGLIALLRVLSPKLSEHEAVEFLCYQRGDLSKLLGCLSGAHFKRSFAIAAEAAKHPEHSAFGSFLLSLDPAKVFLLSSLLSTTVCPTLSNGALEQVKHFLHENPLHIVPARKQLAPRMPSYDLDVICGVEMGSYSHSLCYHVNFLASTHCDGSDDETVPLPKLFFAEIWEQSQDRSTRPSFCCLLPSYDAYISRCSLCEAANNKIVHPPSGNHSGGNAGASLDHFGHRDDEAFDLIFSQAKTWNRAPELVESDFIFFDHTRDHRVTSILTEMSSQSLRHPCIHRVSCNKRYYFE